MITKYQYRLLRAALRDCGVVIKAQRQADACNYLFRKGCLRRSRDGIHDYEITQEGEIAIKSYFQDVSRFWVTTTLSIIAIIASMISLLIK